MNPLLRKLAYKFKPRITIKVIAENAYREQSSALELDRIILFNQEIENEIPKIACGMSTTIFENGILKMKFTCTEKKSRETGEKCLIQPHQKLERTREIVDGKLVQTVFVEGVSPYKVIYRQKNENDPDETSSESDGDE